MPSLVKRFCCPEIYSNQLLPTGKAVDNSLALAHKPIWQANQFPTRSEVEPVASTLAQNSAPAARAKFVPLMSNARSAEGTLWGALYRRMYALKRLGSSPKIEILHFFGEANTSIKC